MDVLVVDNNAVPTVSSEAGVVVVHEAAAGIPHARNRAVREALATNVDALAFVDDDEVPRPTWLAALVEVLRSSNADVVTGPVDPIVPRDTKPWIAAHPFMRRNRTFAGGTVMKDAYTNNVIVVRGVLERPDFRFDERMTTTGGSDTELFRRLARDGVRIAWADEAVVDEPLPAERATVRWILRRSWRLGVNRIQRLRYWERPVASWVLMLMGALAELAVGLVGLAAWPIRPAVGLRGLDRAVRAIATFAALAGVGAREYDSA
jgi:glycosyltransferase involved in cell wall biosynthesis